MNEVELLNWFESSAKPFLERHAKDRLPALEDDYARLKRLQRESDNVTVCFLGNSGVGKSTLLNAVAAGAQQVLPAGGIGPLTAQATEVHFSETPSFKVVYHPKKHLWKVAFALEQRVVRELGVAKKAISESDGAISSEVSDLGSELDESDRKDITVLSVDTSHEGGQPPSDVLEGLIKQAKQIVTDDQFSTRSLPYLVDALRVACGNEQRWGQVLDEADLARLRRIQTIYAQAKQGLDYERVQGSNRPAFVEDMKIHAAGFLSPLIEHIDVGWPSEVLKSGVILVDLPGVGIAQDSYREVTQRYVKERARAVIVVVDRAGPTEATVEMLRSSGYWDRLVGATDDPDSDPCSMLIVVTKVDDVTNENYRNYQPVDGVPRPKKREVFADLVEQFKPRMRAQIHDQLGKIGESSNADVRTARAQARDNVLSTLQIHPVSAPELRKILQQDDDDVAFLQNLEQTGIPQLQASLSLLATTEREARRRRREDVRTRLANSVLNELRIVDGQWRLQGRAEEEAERLAAALEEILAPKREEYGRRVGAFREFLDATVQTKIDALVMEARSAAEEEVREYLMRLQWVHWGTLRAAVRRGGAFSGSRVINLPEDITGYFQEPMAAVWGQRLLKDVRKRTTEMAADIEGMVEEICVWANENGGAQVNAKLLENQRARVSAMAAQMKQVGKEAVDELRDTVKIRLAEEIRKPIKSACEKFVEKGDDYGPGVKSRILELFRALASTATTAARVPATTILRSNFAEVRDEIQQAFSQGGDPIQSTADLIVERHEARVKRSDAQKRGPVLAELERVFEAGPVVLESGDIAVGQ